MYSILIENKLLKWYIFILFIYYEKVFDLVILASWIPCFLLIVTLSSISKYRINSRGQWTVFTVIPFPDQSPISQRIERQQTSSSLTCDDVFTAITALILGRSFPVCFSHLYSLVKALRQGVFTQLYWLMWFNVFTTLSINGSLSGLYELSPLLLSDYLPL